MKFKDLLNVIRGTYQMITVEIKINGIWFEATSTADTWKKDFTEYTVVAVFTDETDINSICVKLEK